MRQRHNNQQPLLHPPRHESVRSCHLSPGCVSFKRGGKSSETSAASSASSAASSATGQQILRRRPKRPRRTLSLLKGSGTECLSCGRLKNSGCVVCSAASTSAGQASASATAAGKWQKVPHRLLQQPQRRLAKPLTGQRSSEVCFRSEDIRNEREASETSAESSKTAAASSASSGRHRHHRRLLQKMRRPDRRQSEGQRHDSIHEGDRGSWQCGAAAQSKSTAESAATRAETAENGQRILHPPWRLRMRARRKGGSTAQQCDQQYV